MERLKFIGKRLVTLLIMLIGVATIVFILTKLVPGDPVTANLSQRSLSDPKIVEAYKVRYGLDKPVIVQYFYYIRNLLRLDLGTSIRTNRPVLEELKRCYPATMELAIFAILVAAAMPGPGRLSSFYAAPPTVTGFYTIDSLLQGNIMKFGDALMHLILPGCVLAAFTMGLITRTTRSNMLDVMSTDYIRTARAKGAPPHHDPFDRMLISQAKAENMTFITHDSLLPYYQEKCIVFV